MAMFDDTQWLLSHIQNSYATSDDSGLSEVVLQGNWPIEKLVDFDFLYPDDTITTEQSYEDPTPHSLDVHADQSYLGHRFRSDTEHRLNKMKKEKNLQAQITRITWQVNPVPLTESEAEELFGCHPVPELQLQTPASLLSRLLDQDDQAQNPYLDYAKWDASTDVNVSSKRLSIYVYNDEQPHFPIKVVVNLAARVIDVIGLTFFLYTRDNLTPPITDPMSAYSLRIADEDGSVDWEFMPLLHSHGIDKFGFRVLAVAKEKQPDTAAAIAAASLHQPVTVTVHISGGVFSLIECESRDIALREVLNRTIAKRREMARVVAAGVQYHLESADDEPGRVLDLDRTLSEMETLILHAVRDNSKRAPITDGGDLNDDAGSASHSFAVTWVKKWAKFDATIDVSYGGVFLAVTGSSSSGLLRPPSPVSYPSNKIVCCNIKTGSSILGRRPVTASMTNKDKLTDGKKTIKKGGSDATAGGGGGKGSSEKSGQGGRCEVLLTCLGEQRFKDYLLECDETVGQELVEAVKRIKTENNSNKEEKPRRRYSLVGLKKKNRASYGLRPPN